MPVRNHKEIAITEFNGLFQRGKTTADADACPPDHFSACNNIKFFEQGFAWRDGISTVTGPGAVIRMYKYKSPSLGEGLLAMNQAGEIYHMSYQPDVKHGPILTVEGANDFAFIEYAGRAYISPITNLHGTVGEFLYVYDGTGGSSVARKAAGSPPTNSNKNALYAYNSTVEGVVDLGIHVIAVSYDDSGDLSTALGPEVFAVVYAPGERQINLANIPITSGKNRVIFMTHAIDPKDFDISSLPTFYEALTIANDDDTTAIISIDDASLTVAFSAGSQLPPSDGGALNAANTTTPGGVDLGLHIYGVVYETDSGFLSAPGPEFYAIQTHALETRKIKIDNVPVGGATVVKRHIVATKMINQFNGDQAGYQFFFVPNGEIPDNTTDNIEVSFYDAELLEDASHLIDNFSEIPAAAAIFSYNGRLGIANGDFGEGVVYLSAPGEPEAIDQVDGVLIPSYPSEHVTNGQEFRDILYIFKKNRTFSYVDNGDVPSLWDEPSVIDNGIGTGFHGIAQVLDSGGINIEFLVIAHSSGLYQFTGTYIKPELSWKINTFWATIDGSDNKTQLFTDSITKRIYIVAQTGRMLMADFTVSLDPKNIKWTPWSFTPFITTIAIFEGPRLLLGSSGNL